MTKQLTNRISKLEDFAGKKEEDDEFDIFLNTAPDIWLQDLVKEVQKLSQHPEIERYLLVIDTSAPKDGHCKYQIFLPGEDNFYKYGHMLLEKPEHFSENLKIFLISKSTDFPQDKICI